VQNQFMIRKILASALTADRYNISFTSESTSCFQIGPFEPGLLQTWKENENSFIVSHVFRPALVGFRLIENGF
jgi:hypothetical protein